MQTHLSSAYNSILRSQFVEPCARKDVLSFQAEIDEDQVLFLYLIRMNGTRFAALYDPTFSFLISELPMSQNLCQLGNFYTYLMCNVNRYIDYQLNPSAQAELKLSTRVNEMSAGDLKESRKICRKKATYDRFWFYPANDFETWKQRFYTEKRNWQMKYPRDGFIWYNHNCIRRKETCNYSKFADKSCGGKMKVPANPDEIGLYRIEFTDDGYQHFVSEFNVDIYDVNDFMSELFEEFPTSSVDEITFPLEIIDMQVLNSNPSESDQSQNEQLSRTNGQNASLLHIVK